MNFVIRRGVASVVVLSLFVAGAAFAGDTTPPPGPVGPTMIPLDKIEPRICVNELPGALDAVHVISQPGQYFLTADITGEPGKHGIRVDVGDVTLDLNGFSLIGVPASGDGIRVAPPPSPTQRTFIMPHALEQSGKISGFSGSGLSTTDVSNVEVRYLRTWGNGGHGVSVQGAEAVSLSNVDSQENGMRGFDLGVTCKENMDQPVKINFCVAMGNALEGGFVDITAGVGGVFCSVKYDCEDSIFCANGGDGFKFAPTDPGNYDLDLRDSNFDGNLGDGFRLLSPVDSKTTHSARDVSMSGNGGNGASLDAAAGGGFVVVWERCNLNNNAGDGVLSTDGGSASNQFDWNKCAMNGNGAPGSGGSGGRVVVGAGSSASGIAADCTFNDNDGFGLQAVGELTLTVQPSRIEIVKGRAQGNGNDGWSLLKVDGSFSKSIASGNGGSGFGQEGGSVHYERCDGKDNDCDGFSVIGGDATYETCDGRDNNCNGYIGDSAPDGGGGLIQSSVSYLHCEASGNTLSGILLQDVLDGSIEGARASSNGASGIRVENASSNVNIRASVLTGNGEYGIEVVGVGHVVVQNSALSNSLGGYLVPVPGNTMGPQVDEGIIDVATNPFANLVR